MWQLVQLTLVWAPVSGKIVLLWSNVEGTHALVLWQTWQSVGKPLAVWFGLVVCRKLFWWHETQVVLRPTNWPLAWQLAQASGICAPVSGNAVLEWSKVAPSQLVVLWHSEQSVGKPALTWLGFVVV